MESAETKTNSTRRQASVQPHKRKPYKGVAMEGPIAKWYAKTQEKSIEDYRSWAKMASGHLPESGRVLELAPGPGYLSVELAKLGRYKVVGLDISKTFVKIATENARVAGVEVDFRQGDAADIPFSDGTFDFAICTAAFKNFPDPVSVLDELFRVLRSGAECVIIDMNKDTTGAEINEFVDGMKLGRLNSFMTRFTFKHMLRRWAYTRSEVQNMAARSRFGACEIVDEGIGFEIWLRKP